MKEPAHYKACFHAREMLVRFRSGISAVNGIGPMSCCESCTCGWQGFVHVHLPGMRAVRPTAAAQAVIDDGTAAVFLQQQLDAVWGYCPPCSEVKPSDEVFHPRQVALRDALGQQKSSHEGIERWPGRMNDECLLSH